MKSFSSLYFSRVAGMNETSFGMVDDVEFFHGAMGHKEGNFTGYDADSEHRVTSHHTRRDERGAKPFSHRPGTKPVRLCVEEFCGAETPPLP